MRTPFAVYNVSTCTVCGVCNRLHWRVEHGEVGLTMHLSCSQAAKAFTSKIDLGGGSRDNLSVAAG